MRASVRFDHELLSVEQEHDVSCMLELTAPPSPASTERLPLAVALVIDRSGSMHGEKLDITRRCASFLVDRLAPTDRLAVVAFDHEVRLAAPLVEVGSNREALRAAIAGLHAGGQTNLSGGWLKGVETLAPLDDGSHTRRVLLLTDGAANIGITDGETLAKMTRASSGDGIGTTTVGFGADFSEELLTAMADAGGGGAHFAATPDAAPGIFAQEFTDLLSLVAQNVSVEIRPAWDQVAVLSILNDVPQVQVAGGVQCALGDAYGDETRRVVFQLRVPRLQTLGPAKVADVVLRYVAVGGEVAMHEVTAPVIVNAVSAEDAAAAVPDAEVTEEVVILLGARAQDDARDLADRGEFDAAQQRLFHAAKQLRSLAKDSPRADDLETQARRFDEQAMSLTPDMYDPLQRKLSMYSARELKQRRQRPTQDRGGDR